MRCQRPHATSPTVSFSTIARHMTSPRVCARDSLVDTTTYLPNSPLHRRAQSAWQGSKQGGTTTVPHVAGLAFLAESSQVEPSQGYCLATYLPMCMNTLHARTLHLRTPCDASRTPAGQDRARITNAGPWSRMPGFRVSSRGHLRQHTCGTGACCTFLIFFSGYAGCLAVSVAIEIAKERGWVRRLPAARCTCDGIGMHGAPSKGIAVRWRPRWSVGEIRFRELGTYDDGP